VPAVDREEEREAAEEQDVDVHLGDAEIAEPITLPTTPGTIRSAIAQRSGCGTSRDMRFSTP
jgi:hypothetical protein